LVVHLEENITAVNPDLPLLKPVTLLWEILWLLHNDVTAMLSESPVTPAWHIHLIANGRENLWI
jgi:hypothetical protein